MRLDNFGHAQQSLPGDARLGFLRQLAASHRIKHPARHRDLEARRQLHDVDLVEESSQRANDSDLRSEKRMVTVLDLFGSTQFMSSMGRRCDIRTLRIFLSAARTFASSKSISAIQIRR